MKQEYRKLIQDYCFSHKDLISGLKAQRVLVTGATGLIGRTFTHILCEANQLFDLRMQIYCLVRNESKARFLFKEYIDEGDLNFFVSSIETFENIPMPVDYIVHTASPTSSSYFINHPVELIETGYRGTKNILNLGVNHKVKKILYLSSMEIYGNGKKDQLLKEEDVGYVNPNKIRSSYPETKRMCELLCCSYASEYNVPVCSMRLAQTFGPGVDKDDERLFAYLLRCVLKGENIQLMTDGLSERMYLYTFDAVSAIIVLLLKGEPGNTYNVANKDTYCNILQLAQLVIDHFAEKEIRIQVPDQQIMVNKFSPKHYLKLDVSKIEELGWKAETDLVQMYSNMLKCL